MSFPPLPVPPSPATIIRYNQLKDEEEEGEDKDEDKEQERERERERERWGGEGGAHLPYWLNPLQGKLITGTRWEGENDCIHRIHTQLFQTCTTRKRRACTQGAHK